MLPPEVLVVVALPPLRAGEVVVGVLLRGHDQLVHLRLVVLGLRQEHLVVLSGVVGRKRRKS